MIWKEPSYTSSLVETMTIFMSENMRQISFKTQFNPQVSHKGMVNLQRRRYRRWSWSSEYLLIKQKGLGFTVYQSYIHAFYAGDTVQWECIWLMEGTHRQIWGVRQKIIRYKLSYKQV